MFVILYLEADERLPDEAPDLSARWEEAAASLDTVRNIDVFGNPVAARTESWVAFRVEQGRTSRIVAGGAGGVREEIERGIGAIREDLGD